MKLIRLFGTLKSSALPLESTGQKLKIFSLTRDGRFRLTNGAKSEHGGIAIIGANHVTWHKDHRTPKSIESILKVLRPLPEIVVLGGIEETELEDWAAKIKANFGCSVETSRDEMTAGTMFNTLIDDDRCVIGFFSTHSRK